MFSHVKHFLLDTSHPPRILRQMPSFTPPSADEVARYCQGVGFTHVDPHAFVSYHTSHHWKSVKTSWRAACRTWEYKARKALPTEVTMGKRPEPPSSPQLDLFRQEARRAYRAGKGWPFNSDLIED